MAKTKSSTKRKAAPKRSRSAGKKTSLVENINKRKRAGTSRPKSRSTISKDAYDAMEQGWPKKNASHGSSTRTSKKRASTSKKRASTPRKPKRA